MYHNYGPICRVIITSRHTVQCVHTERRESFRYTNEKSQFSFLVTQGKREETVERLWHSWEDNPKMDSMDQCDPGEGPVVGAHDYGTAPSGTTEGENCLTS